jgi:hypothetical protein
VSKSSAADRVSTVMISLPAPFDPWLSTPDSPVNSASTSGSLSGQACTKTLAICPSCLAERPVRKSRLDLTVVDIWSSRMSVSSRRLTLAFTIGPAGWQGSDTSTRQSRSHPRWRA